MHYLFIQQMDDAVAEVFRLMLGRACTPDETEPGECIDEGAARTSTAPMSATIFFSGTLGGACSIHLDHAAAAQIACDLVGVPAYHVSGDLAADTAAEICNMITGSWKGRQPTAQSECTLSVPVVMQGSMRGARRFVYTLERIYRFADHSLTVELGFNQILPFGEIFLGDRWPADVRKGSPM